MRQAKRRSVAKKEESRRGEKLTVPCVLLLLSEMEPAIASKTQRDEEKPDDGP
jgi:hypothetical protein